MIIPRMGSIVNPDVSRSGVEAVVAASSRRTSITALCAWLLESSGVVEFPPANERGRPSRLATHPLAMGAKLPVLAIGRLCSSEHASRVLQCRRGEHATANDSDGLDSADFGYRTRRRRVWAARRSVPR